MLEYFAAGKGLIKLSSNRYDFAQSMFIDDEIKSKMRDLELALEAALGIPVRGLGREELLEQAAQALGVDRAAELDEHLSALDAAAYGPSEQTAEAMKARLVDWLGAST